jgi:pimeloyl-ACP methyl ester carboxylesterase
MDIILVPGFWLDASSWDAVTPVLKAAGHRPTALTLPGLESLRTDRSAITLRDHVDAVVAAVDALHDPVVLVGHSGGGAIIHAAVDARPTRVVRAIYVDSGPLGDGQAINDQLPAVDGEIPLPEWSLFEAEDLIDLGDDLRTRFRAIAIPEPAAVARDAQVLSDPRRYDVAVTIIACEVSSDTLRSWIASGHPHVAELAKIADRELVDLPTGHWPQFTRPHDLAMAILKAIDRAPTSTGSQ